MTAGVGSTESGDGAGHVLATYGYALLARVVGDRAQARALYAAALAGFEELGTPVPAGLALAGLARCDELDDLPELAPFLPEMGDLDDMDQRAEVTEAEAVASS